MILSRLQKLPDELLSLIGQGLEAKDFLAFFESLRLDPCRRVPYQGVRNNLGLRVENDRISTALKVLEAFPQVVDLQLYVSLEDDVLPLLASDRVQNLSSLALWNDALFFDVAAFEAMVCGAERRGPQVIRRHCASYSKTYRIPNGEHHFALRCSFDRFVHPMLVEKFRQDVIEFVGCPDNLLPRIISPAFYEACEYFVDASLVNDDAAIELFIDQFPDREVIYQVSPSADIDFLVERYRNRQVVLLISGEVVSLGVNPPDDIEQLSQIISLFVGWTNHTVTVLDPNRRQTTFPNPNERGIRLCQLLEFDPGLRRRRYLNFSHGLVLVSFDVEAARRSPEAFRQDSMQHRSTGCDVVLLL